MKRLNLRDLEQKRIRAKFGERLRMLRCGTDFQKYSDEIVPSLYSTNSKRWRRREDGKCEPLPAFEVLCKIALFFNASIDWPLGLTEDATPLRREAI